MFSKYRNIQSLRGYFRQNLGYFRQNGSVAGVEAPGAAPFDYSSRNVREPSVLVAISILIVATLLTASRSSLTSGLQFAFLKRGGNSLPQLPTFFLSLSHTPVPVNVTKLHSVSEVARAAVVELELPIKLGRPVTVADVSLFVISRDEAFRLMTDDSHVVSAAAKGTALSMLDDFDVNVILTGGCLLVELKAFTRATLMIMFSTPKNLVTLPHLRRWYSPHFKRIVVYCTKDTPETNDTAAADSARALLSALSASPSLVDGVVFTYADGSLFLYSHYIHFISSELASGTNGEDGLFAITADVLINTRLLRNLSSALPILPSLNSLPNDANNVGRNDSTAWYWWEKPIGRPALLALEHDIGLGSIVKSGEKIKFVAGYADFFYIPRSSITSFLRDCFEVFYRNRVFHEIGTPSVLYWCVNRDISVWPYNAVDGCRGHSRPCSYQIMWEDTNRIYRPNGIEQAMGTALFIHPVNLREHPEIISRIDTALQWA